MTARGKQVKLQTLLTEVLDPVMGASILTLANELPEGDLCV